MRMQMVYALQPPVVSPEVPTDEEGQQQQNSDSSIMPSDPSLSTQPSKVRPGASNTLLTAVAPITPSERSRAQERSAAQIPYDWPSYYWLWCFQAGASSAEQGPPAAAAGGGGLAGRMLDYFMPRQP